MKKVLVVGLGVAGTAALNRLVGEKSSDEEIEVDVCEVKEKPWTFLSCGELVPDPNFLSKYTPENIRCVLYNSHKLIEENTVIINRFRRLVLKIMGREYEFKFSAFLIDKSKLIKSLCDRVLAHVNRYINSTVERYLYIPRKGEIKVKFASPDIESRNYNFIIAADSFESCMYTERHRMYLIRKGYLWLTCTSFRARIRDLEKDSIYIIIDPSIAPGGYAWIFPRDVETANCGLGVHPHFSACIFSLTEKFLNKYRVGPRENMLGKALPVDGTIKPHTVFDGRVMFVGDAGGFVIPTSGAGINTAIFTGEKAAEAVLGFTSFEAGIKNLADYIDWLADLRKPLDPVLLGEDALRKIMKRIPGRAIAMMAYYMMLGSVKFAHRALFSIAKLVASALGRISSEVLLTGY